MADPKPQIQKSQKTLSWVNIKEKVFWVTSENKTQQENLERAQIIKVQFQQRKYIRIDIEFSSEIIQARKEWSKIFKHGMKKKKKNPANQEFFICQNYTLK